MNTEMGIAEGIRDLLTDGDGEYLCGLKNVITVSEVLQHLGIPNTKENATRMQVNINNVLNRISRETGFITGGVSRNPTYYMIASNRSEEKLLTLRSIPQLVGRAKNYARRGQNVLTTSEQKRLSGATKAAQTVQKRLAADKNVIDFYEARQRIG